MLSSAESPETARDGRFIAYDNGTVLDTKTKLMWAAKDNGDYINWEDAKSYCEKYRGGGSRTGGCRRRMSLRGFMMRLKRTNLSEGLLFI